MLLNQDSVENQVVHQDWHGEMKTDSCEILAQDPLLFLMKMRNGGYDVHILPMNWSHHTKQEE